MYANIVNNYTKSKFSVIFPICLFKYISPINNMYNKYAMYLISKFVKAFDYIHFNSIIPITGFPLFFRTGANAGS